MERKEAIKIIRENWPEASYTPLREALETLIPELKESEDERIRKVIRQLLFGMREEIFTAQDKIVTKVKVLAWLERQKEQKPAEKQDYSGLNDLERAILRGFLSAGVENVPVTIIKETAQECLAQMKPAEWSEDYREEDLRTRFAFYTYKDEDDALYLSNVFVEETSRNKGLGTKILAAAEKVAETLGIISIRLKVKQNSTANDWYRKHGYGYIAFEGDYDWLEKTLEYLKPIKQKWSEEDEKMLSDCIEAVGSMSVRSDVKTLRDWLKSLRPQSHWKPSEEQLLQLRCVISGCSYDIEPLVSLEEQLKQL